MTVIDVELVFYERKLVQSCIQKTNFFSPGPGEYKYYAIMSQGPGENCVQRPCGSERSPGNAVRKGIYISYGSARHQFD